MKAYSSMDSITIGNGGFLPIHHTSNIKVQTPTWELNLINALHVPGIFRKLISIRCFAADLNAYISIDENGFFVKEKHTGMTIVHGCTVVGLYHLPKHQIIGGKAFAGVRTSPQMLHHLGHPTTPVLKKVYC